MKVVYHILAKEDFAEIIDFLEVQEFERLRRFIKDFRLAIRRIRDFPQAWQKVTPKVRVKIVSKRFLFGIYYTQSRTEIHIGAIIHLSRGPKSWKSRFRK